MNVPPAVGVPEITPVELASESPVGRLPALTFQVRGAFPPAATRVWLYATLTDPDGKDEVVIDNGATEPSGPPNTPMSFLVPSVSL